MLGSNPIQSYLGDFLVAIHIQKGYSLSSCEQQGAVRPFLARLGNHGGVPSDQRSKGEHRAGTVASGGEASSDLEFIPLICCSFAISIVILYDFDSPCLSSAPAVATPLYFR